MLDYILELLKCRDISPALCAVGNASMEAGPLDEADNISNCCGEDLWSAVKIWGPFHNLPLPLSSDLYISTTVCSIYTRYKGSVADTVSFNPHVAAQNGAFTALSSVGFGTLVFLCRCRVIPHCHTGMGTPWWLVTEAGSAQGCLW